MCPFTDLKPTGYVLKELRPQALSSVFHIIKVSYTCLINSVLIVVPRYDVVRASLSEPLIHKWYNNAQLIKVYVL